MRTTANQLKIRNHKTSSLQLTYSQEPDKMPQNGQVKYMQKLWYLEFDLLIQSEILKNNDHCSCLRQSDWVLTLLINNDNLTFLSSNHEKDCANSVSGLDTIYL